MICQLALYCSSTLFITWRWKTNKPFIGAIARIPNSSAFFLWKQLDINSWTFVHIRNFLVRLSSMRVPSVIKYEWTHTACNECSALCDVHLTLFWVWIKHQVMHRLSCLFEFKSVFIHTSSWKPLCEHTYLRDLFIYKKKCFNLFSRIYVKFKGGGGSWHVLWRLMREEIVE